MPTKTPSASPNDKTLEIIRFFDAPASLVFAAWTDRQHVIKWLAPIGFVVTHAEADVRPGGAWKSCMRSPQGEDLWVGGVYQQVIPDARLVFTHAWLDPQGNPRHTTLVEMLLEESDGKTRMTFRQGEFMSIESRDGHVGGWSESFDKLQALLLGTQMDSSGTPLETSDINPDREIVYTRLLDAPRELVFSMWTDAAHLDKWWGPRGFTTTTSEIDVRTGGRWRHVMRGPDGQEFPNDIRYVEVNRPRRIIYEHVLWPFFTAVVTFLDVNGKTRLTKRMIFADSALRQQVAQEFGAVEGLKQTIDRLGEHLQSEQSAASAFVMSREFAAPREKVFAAWSQPKHLAQWLGPRGWETVSSTMDFRPGGTYHYCMSMPNGQQLWGKFVYREIDPPNRLEWVHSFSDADGGLQRHVFDPNWPLEILSTVTFEERGAGTLVTLRWLPINASPPEIAAFEAAKKSLEGGWTMSFSQLAEYLPQL